MADTKDFTSMSHLSVSIQSLKPTTGRLGYANFTRRVSGRFLTTRSSPRTVSMNNRVPAASA
jgi:hypothetical protein